MNFVGLVRQIPTCARVNLHFERQAVQAEVEAVQADEAPMGLETDDDKLLADFEEALREVQATEARPVDKYKRKASQAEKTPCKTRKKKAVKN